MKVIWTFDRGNLTVKHLSGEVLFAWPADPSLGEPLADLLNQNQRLSDLILEPIVGG